MLKENILNDEISKKEEAIVNIIGKKIVHNDIEVSIEKAYISKWTNLHYATVKDNEGQLYIIDLDYDYKNNTFNLVGDYQLPL